MLNDVAEGSGGKVANRVVVVDVCKLLTMLISGVTTCSRVNAVLATDHLLRVRESRE